MTCANARPLREPGRSQVYRLAVSGGRAPSVILKAPVADEPAPQSAQDRLCNEWAGCAMLGTLGLGPQPIAGDTEALFCLMEDLGAGETLADALTSDDPDRATASLFAYARGLGAMHA
ncbi:MAG: hypothetical protein ACREEQ_11280, partial [Caulobacteraceae bacterium]